LADKGLRTVISLRFSALAGAFLVGVAGAKWITSEVDKRLLKESVKVAVNSNKLPKEKSEHITEGSPRQVLHDVKEACDTCAVAEAASRNFSLKENKRPSFRGITAMTSRS
jgi:hypothetical protein